MIDLAMQIKAIIFSFLYGIFTSIMVNINYKCLFHKKVIFKIVFNFIFVIDLGMLYFFLLQFIDYGYLHIYFLIVFIVGFLLSFKFCKEKLRKNMSKSK